MDNDHVKCVPVCIQGGRIKLVYRETGITGNEPGYPGIIDSYPVHPVLQVKTGLGGETSHNDKKDKKDNCQGQDIPAHHGEGLFYFPAGQGGNVGQRAHVQFFSHGRAAGIDQNPGKDLGTELYWVSVK